MGAQSGKGLGTVLSVNLKYLEGANPFKIMNIKNINLIGGI